MSGAITRMPRQDAIAIAKRFVALIEPYTDQLIVAGSLRRRLAYIGDIEVVTVPKVEWADVITHTLFGEHVDRIQVDRLDLRMSELLEAGTVTKRLDAKGSPRWGSKLKYLTYQGANVDLFTPEGGNFGWHLLLRTGPYKFSKQLVVPKGKRTDDGRPGLMPAYLISEGGWLRYRTSRETIPTPTEKSVFDLFGIPHIEPWSRA